MLNFVLILNILAFLQQNLNTAIYIQNKFSIKFISQNILYIILRPLNKKPVLCTKLYKYIRS